ncbi:MAG: hypothetical protein L3K09_04490 [Thermoplasmata archaeon]|nr:hypothetical protein [Thermoplasmata archaeon]
MRLAGVIVFWVGLIIVLFLIEAAEITHLFTIPITAVGQLFSFVFALVFTTIVALVGAIFIGIYVSQRLRSNTGFTVFEEEMLKMRSDLTAVREAVEELRRSSGASSSPPADPELEGKKGGST